MSIGFGYYRRCDDLWKSEAEVVPLIEEQFGIWRKSKSTSIARLDEPEEAQLVAVVGENLGQIIESAIPRTYEIGWERIYKRPSYWTYLRWPDGGHVRSDEYRNGSLRDAIRHNT